MGYPNCMALCVSLLRIFKAGKHMGWRKLRMTRATRAKPGWPLAAFRRPTLKPDMALNRCFWDSSCCNQMMSTDSFSTVQADYLYFLTKLLERFGSLR